MQQLLNRIDELEKQLNRIEEESKARKKLQVTEEEKQQQEKEVLDAVSREYTLEPKHTLAIDYSLGYSYSPNEEYITQEKVLTDIRLNAEHTVSHNLSGTYSILDNLSMSTSLPVKYVYYKKGTDDELSATDIGDISLGVAWQPVKTKAGGIRGTVSLGLQLPTGRSPYEINPNKEIATGSGVYSFSLGGNFSKQVDPVVVFWSLGYTHALELDGLGHKVADNVTLDNVKTGDQFSLGMGMGYALSYATSVNMTFNYGYERSSTLKYKEISTKYKTGDSVSASVGMGMGWRVSNKTTLSYSLGYSLTGSSFSFSFRVPFSFVM